jgi:monoterpene epsilon-lactone hydrolase
MSQHQRETVHEILRNAPFDLGGDVATQRPLLDHILTAHPLAADVATRKGTLGGIPAVFITVNDSSGGENDTDSADVIFHLHGGGFSLGSAAGSVGLASDFARHAGMRAVSIDYRLSPENPYPAALDDVVAAYTALVQITGSGRRIIVSGESAGGNLAVELLIAAKRNGTDQPAAAVLFSPVTDLTVSGDTYRSKAKVDPNVTAEAIQRRANEYLAGTGTHEADPSVSPIFADLRGLPPLLIQAGSHEVLLDDAVRLAGRAAADDVAVTLDITPEVPHVFQAFAGILDEGDDALARAATFIRQHREVRQRA